MQIDCQLNMLGLLPPPMSSKHSFSEQPNDHLNLIMGMLEGRDLYALMRTNHRLASFAAKHLPKAQKMHNAKLADALAELEAKNETVSEPQLRQVLERCVVPGVTVSRVGAEYDDLWKSLRGRKLGNLLTDAHVELILARCGAALKVLSVGAPNFGRSGVTDKSIEAVAAQCAGLTELNLRCCNKLTDRAIEAVASRFTGLTTLNVDSCVNITDSAIEAVAVRCAGLAELNLWGCNKITDRAIEAVASRCAGLTTLHVAWCNLLTDRAIEAVAARCAGLTALSMQFTSLTDRSLQVLSSSRLTQVSTVGSKITDVGKEVFKRARPGVLQD